MFAPMMQQFGNPQGGMQRAYNNQNRNPFAARQPNWGGQYSGVMPRGYENQNAPQQSAQLGMEEGQRNLQQMLADRQQQNPFTQPPQQPAQAPQAQPPGQWGGMPMPVGFGPPPVTTQQPAMGTLALGNRSPQQPPWDWQAAIPEARQKLQQALDAKQNAQPPSQPAQNPLAQPTGSGWGLLGRAIGNATGNTGWGVRQRSQAQPPSQPAQNPFAQRQQPVNPWTSMFRQGR